MTNSTRGSEMFSSDEHKTTIQSGLYNIPFALYPNPLLVGQTDNRQILKQQADTLFLKLSQKIN